MICWLIMSKRLFQMFSCVLEGTPFTCSAKNNMTHSESVDASICRSHTASYICDKANKTLFSDIRSHVPL